jgi:hypothetical protein
MGPGCRAWRRLASSTASLRGGVVVAGSAAIVFSCQGTRPIAVGEAALGDNCSDPGSPTGAPSVAAGDHTGGEGLVPNEGKGSTGWTG